MFLYKEDFAHFTEGLQDVIAFVQNQLGTIEERPEWTPEKEEEEAAGAAEEPKKKGLFGIFGNNSRLFFGYLLCLQG